MLTIKEILYIGTPQMLHLSKSKFQIKDKREIDLSMQKPLEIKQQQQQQRQHKKEAIEGC